MTLVLGNDQWSEVYLRQVEETILSAVACNSSAAEQAVTHIVDSRGKRLRPLLVKLSSSFGPASPSAVTTMAAAAELIHTASLVHDDIIDRAASRRGQATAHHLWGNQAAVLLGDFLFARAFRLLVESHLYNGVRWFSAAIADMCQSEIEQAHCLFELEPVEDHYLRRIGLKTASLIEACCRAGADLSGLEEDAADGILHFGRRLGMAYQLTDDLLDFLSTPALAGKPVASDFRRGVLTLPVIYLMEEAKPRQRIQEMLRRRQVSDDEWQLVRDMVITSGALSRAQEAVEHHIGEACRALTVLPPSPERYALESLCQQLVSRQH